MLRYEDLVSEISIFTVRQFGCKKTNLEPQNGIHEVSEPGFNLGRAYLTLFNPDLAVTKKNAQKTTRHKYAIGFYFAFYR